MGKCVCICGKCGQAMRFKEKIWRGKTYVYYECEKCGNKTKSENKDNLLNAG
jgi:DNA-directed RNA polymerase subunit M/transcription elongation factor TFIIS